MFKTFINLNLVFFFSSYYKESVFHGREWDAALVSEGSKTAQNRSCYSLWISHWLCAAFRQTSKTGSGANWNLNDRFHWQVNFFFESLIVYICCTKLISTFHTESPFCCSKSTLSAITIVVKSGDPKFCANVTSKCWATKWFRSTTMNGTRCTWICPAPDRTTSKSFCKSGRSERPSAWRSSVYLSIYCLMCCWTSRHCCRSSVISEIVPMEYIL